MKHQAKAAAELEASLNLPMRGSLSVRRPSLATTAPASKAAATPGGWGVKNAAKAVVNGLGNSKASTTPTCMGNDNGCYDFMFSGWTKKAQ